VAGAILTDADPPLERRDSERTGALGALVRDARGKARLRLVGIRRPGNPVGAESVLTWQTGFPSAVSWASGAPRYGPGEWSGEAVLARGEVDAVLIVGAEPERFLSGAALAGLKRVPTVFVEAPIRPATQGQHRYRHGALRSHRGHVFRMTVALQQHSAKGEAAPENPDGEFVPRRPKSTAGSPMRSRLDRHRGRALARDGAVRGTVTERLRIAGGRATTLTAPLARCACASRTVSGSLPEEAPAGRPRSGRGGAGIHSHVAGPR
jgi:hypothetical protein